jgi:amino acid transporter
MASSRAGDDARLSLFDAVAMAMGGMIGGGIFAVLGEGVRRAGNGTFLAFLLGGILALLTGMSYSRLTLRFDEAGGSFSYVEHVAGRRAAGTLSWFLLLGYTFTLGLYAHTFGAYAADLVGLGAGSARWLGVAIVAGLAGLNLIGVRESGLAEDILVYGKVAILVVVGCVSLFTVRTGEALPVLEHGTGGVVATAALIFVAYEGFQLLTYDYDDIADKHRNLPRAVHISIPAVIAIYMLVAFVTTGSLTDDVIARHSETVLAYAAEPILGRTGRMAVLVAAVFSTASAINATLFASARLAGRVQQTGELPEWVGRWRRGGVSVAFILLMSVTAMVIQATADLGQITTFSSLVFLSVFAIVNAAAVPHAVFHGAGRALPLLGAAGCAVAAVALAYDTATNEGVTLLIVGGVAASVLIARAIDLRVRRRSGS